MATRTKPVWRMRWAGCRGQAAGFGPPPRISSCCGRRSRPVTVIMEPTRNAWVPLAAWFRRHGAQVVLVPPEQSADLRGYYNEHTKSDRLDSRVLARLPRLILRACMPPRALGPGDPLRRPTRLRASLVKRRTSILARLDALLEILGPGWREAFHHDLANITPLRFLAAGYTDPNKLRRLGRARLSRFLYRHSREAWGEDLAEQLLTLATETQRLWRDGLEFADLADDIAVEARLALELTAEINELDERIKVLMRAADRNQIMMSVPGVADKPGALILGGGSG